MKLPQAHQAVIAKAKITDYLLSFDHPYGRSKARFFAQNGFSVARWQELETALLRHATTGDIVATIETPYGMKYVIEGPINTPRNTSPTIRAVWFIEPSDRTPRFVTAYPS